MNLHPRINGTVGLWQLQSDLKDSSGNGLDAVSVAGTTNLPTAPNAFAALGNKNSGTFVADPCLVGLPMTGSSDPKLMMPFSTLFHLTGPMTVEWLMMQTATFETAYMACADPAGRLGGNGVDRIGSLYSLWSNSGNPAVTDQNMGSNIPSSTYPFFGGYNDHILFNWADVGRPAGGDFHTHHFACVRDASGNWQAYRDGATAGAGVLKVGNNVPLGTERLFIGGYELNSGGGGSFASVRLLNYARTGAQIFADANFTLGTCGGIAVPPVTDGAGPAYNVATESVAFAADTGRIYRTTPPGHMPQLKGNR